MGDPSSSKVAVVGVILTAITIIIGLYNHSRDAQQAKEKEIQEQKLQHEQEIKSYSDKVENFLIEVNKHVSETKEDTRISINNKTDKRLSFAIHYLSLNGIWVTEGYLVSPKNSVTNFTAHTSNPIIYIYSSTPGIKNLKFNSETIKDSIGGDIVPIEGFMIINFNKPPFEIKKVNFYKVMLSNDNMLTVENPAE